jgi:hypothetical protein
LVLPGIGVAIAVAAVCMCYLSMALSELKISHSVARFLTVGGLALASISLGLVIIRFALVAY